MKSGSHMKTQGSLSDRLKQLGFAQENRMKLYGQEFEILSDPIIIKDHLVFVDAIEKSSGERKRVRIPLNVLNMVRERTEAVAA
jgi:hypothetical protein